MDSIRPDVEKIMAQIRERAAGSPASEPNAEAAAEGDLYHHLNAANRACLVGQTHGSGPAAMLRRAAQRPLGTLVADINRFHAETVRVLNEMVRILEGENTPANSELLAKNRRRIEILTQLSERLAAYDDLQIERRLADIEARLAALEG